MRNGIEIVDIHVHAFDRVEGMGPNGITQSAPFGMIADDVGEHVFMPPWFEKTSFSVDAAVRMMDVFGVDRALLVQNPVIGHKNDLIVEATCKFKGRLLGAMQVDPMDPAATEKMERFAQCPGMVLLKLEMSRGWGWSGIYEGLYLDSDRIIRLVRTAGRLGLAMMIDTGLAPADHGMTAAVMAIVEHFPDVPFLLEHLGCYTPDIDSSPDGRRRWQSLILLAKLPNVYIGLAASGFLLQEEYPCRRSLELIWWARDHVGAHKLLWGSDIPGTLSLYTYAQMIDTVLLHADFLDFEEKALVMGGNARRLLWKDEGVSG